MNSDDWFQSEEYRMGGSSERYRHGNHLRTVRASSSSSAAGQTDSFATSSSSSSSGGTYNSEENGTEHETYDQFAMNGYDNDDVDDGGMANDRNDVTNYEDIAESSTQPNPSSNTSKFSTTTTCREKLEHICRWPRRHRNQDNNNNSNNNNNNSNLDEWDHSSTNGTSTWCCGMSTDTRRVVFWMMIVLLMIGVTAFIVLSITFSFLETEEQIEFENGFQQQANIIAEATKYHATTVVSSLEALSDTITSFSRSSSAALATRDVDGTSTSMTTTMAEPDEDGRTGETAVAGSATWDFINNQDEEPLSGAGRTWPYITVPDFDRRGQRSRTDAYIKMIGFSPLVTYEDRHGWVNYTRQNSEEILGSFSSRDLQQSIYRLDDKDDEEVEVFPDDNIVMVPYWETSPAPYDSKLINYNLISDDLYYFLFNAMQESEHTALSAVYTNQHIYDHLFGPSNPSEITRDDELNERSGSGDTGDGSSGRRMLSFHEHHEGDFEVPHSVLMAPVYDNFNVTTRKLAGIIHGILPWDRYLTELLPVGTDGIICVLQNSCGQVFTFEINGPYANFLGEGDLHDPQYDDMAVEVDFGSGFLGEIETKTYRQCFYSLIVYPSEDFQEIYTSSGQETVKFMVLLAGIFAILGLFFIIFVVFVERRQKKVMGIATRTTAIISSLFPDNVRQRLLKQAEKQATKEAKMINNREGSEGGDDNLQDILHEAGGSGKVAFNSATSKSFGSTAAFATATAASSGITIYDDAPIADLYSACTVIFADLVGFTAWSSTRDPEQVFVLLETLYGAFDVIVKRRHIFKVETIGDCYVAVAGLPKPRRDHAVVMANFAADMLAKSVEVFHCLETALGPGTAALNLRIGLHSGPLTAGVLRGEKGRFQLFGDTVNTTARIESNGQSGRIHCSQDTAVLLQKAGKGSWLEERRDKIVAKGKGELTTFWVSVRGSGMESESNLSHGSGMSPDSAVTASSNMMESARKLQTLNPIQKKLSKQHARLVDWAVELLSSLLKTIVASRGDNISKGVSRMSVPTLDVANMPFNEWAQAIDLPSEEMASSMHSSKKKGSKKKQTSNSVELPMTVIAQLRNFVTLIASLHGDNPFHNFDHAGHVTMSVHKLLLRIIKSGGDAYRVASDPLTHFAAVLSALIHDVDHIGVPNARLVVEAPQLAKRYSGKSVAEQHAIDLAWQILTTNDHYKELCGTIYTTSSELKRFRTVLVNSVLSTDIVDKELKALRNERWAVAFSDVKNIHSDADRYRASSVLEHLIQASDISHTMQHWHVYRKWNQCLFFEQYQAYLDGRSSTNPADNWYEGEIGFFKFYIIPLAQKLQEVGVFGSSGREYLDFAEKNLAEWEVKGKAVVEEMIAKVSKLQSSSKAKRINALGEISASGNTIYSDVDDAASC